MSIVILNKNSGCFKKGNPGFWLGKKRPNMTGKNHPMFGKKLPPEWVEKLRIAHRGVKLSDQAKQKLRIFNLSTGKKPPVMRGANNSNWRGGVTVENEKIRKSVEYKQWRSAVFERDRYTCQMCGKKGSGDLNADHVMPFSLFPDLRFEVLNGQTLCIPCHRKTPTYGDLRMIKKLHML